jgi:hypothetical protein
MASEKTINSEVNKGVSMDLGKTQHPDLYEPKIESHENVLSDIQKQSMSQQNAIRIGVVVSSKRVHKGSERMKDGKVLTNQNGEPLRYPDSFYATVDFMGGTLETKLEEELYRKVIEGCTYSARGRLKNVSNFGETSLQPVFNDFVYLFGNEDF